MKKSDHLERPDVEYSITKYNVSYKDYMLHFKYMSKNVKRLYRQFIPQHYKIETIISEDKRSFSGKTTISGQKTGRPSKRITLHQKNLKIKSIAVLQIDKNEMRTELSVDRFVAHNSYDELRIHFPDTIYPSKIEITIEYSGTITNNMDGIYPCYFTDNGVEKQLIATQFESHHAREVFPCIDEPEAKATFSVSLTHDSNETALSNTPLAEALESGSRTTSHFEKTPIMSTYLVAFVIGEMKYLEKTSKNGVKIRTYAVPNQIEHATFALDVAVKAMDFYEEYYDIHFPLPKCDFVALPDFASGAMENWGLITFREQTLLVDPHTSLTTKQYVAIVVAHELTHQWFGNLVTMRWWTDLWLNEGFASWMEYLAVDALFPQWDVWTQFAVDEQQSALKADSLEHTHPIEVTVHHPDEIRTIFDIISYQKGASVIHMLHNYLGPDAFRDGLRHYLKSHAYNNTDTVDLWRALEEVTGKPVMDFMHGWTTQEGYPLVSVDKKNDVLHLRQQRFVMNPKSESRSDEHTWQIPLLTPASDTDSISKRHEKVVVKDAGYILLNEGQTGFYRVDYTHDLQKLLIGAIEAGTLSETDRMGLLSDGFEITKAGFQPITEFLQLLTSYSNDSSLPVWEIIAQSIGAIRQTLSRSDTDDELRDAMKPFIDKLTKVQLENLGWEAKKNEKHLNTLLRPLIIALSASSDNPATLETLAQLYRQQIDTDNPVDPDIRTTVYATAVRRGGLKEYDELLERYKNTLSSDEKLSITAALTSFESTDIHHRILELTKTDVVRKQDVGYWLAYSFMNRHARLMTWDWMKENWSWLKASLGTDLSFYRMPVYAARNFADENLKEDYIRFFSGQMQPVLKRSYDQGLEMIETNIAWRERDSKLALDWFKARRS